MPLFEYHCHTCKKNFEVLQRTREVNKTPECPHCGTENTKKRLSAFTAKGTQKDVIKDNAT